MNCSGLHCPGCGHGPRTRLGAVLLVLAVAFIAVKYRAIEHGAAEVARVLALVAIAAVCVTVAAVAAIAARWYHRRTVRAPETRTVLPVVIRHLGPPGRDAIEPARQAADCPYSSCHHNAPADPVPAWPHSQGGQR